MSPAIYMTVWSRVRPCWDGPRTPSPLNRLIETQLPQPRRGISPPLQRLHQRRADHHPVDVPTQPLDLLAAADVETRAHRKRGTPPHAIEVADHLGGHRDM